MGRLARAQMSRQVREKCQEFRCTFGRKGLDKAEATRAPPVGRSAGCTCASRLRAHDVYTKVVEKLKFMRSEEDAEDMRRSPSLARSNFALRSFRRALQQVPNSGNERAAVRLGDDSFHADSSRQ